MLTDDLPWPELGNVTRGATRGNQGQKGILGPPDRDGRCVLQLRVQPGVLAVRLNRQSSDWYRTLDGEVNRALKLTKTYWRKARRRQDYDARADQDHMELHEWLQQLKDKTMTHLELLMQKGDIQGPPYTMPDNIELTFLRKFIERQAAGIPHNPRLRRMMGDKHYVRRDPSVGSSTPDPSERGYFSATEPVAHARLAGENVSESSSAKIRFTARTSLSPSLRDIDSVMQEANTSKLALLGARDSLARAQKDTQDAFSKYISCLDTEQKARLEVSAAEKERDDIMSALLVRSTSTAASRRSSISTDEHQSPPVYHREVGARSIDDLKPHSEIFLQKLHGQPVQDFRHSLEPSRLSREVNKSVDWSEADGQSMYSDEDPSKASRKHVRGWDHVQDGQYACEDITTLPPRKRVHHMAGSFDSLSNGAIQSQGLTLPS